MSPVPLPSPLVQIVLGAFIASVANLGVKLQPDTFFLLSRRDRLAHRFHRGFRDSCPWADPQAIDAHS
jgi:hypothetical protein